MNGSAVTLRDEQVDLSLSTQRGWRREGDALVRELRLLAVLALAALLTRAVAAAARAVLPQRRAETGGKA